MPHRTENRSLDDLEPYVKARFLAWLEAVKARVPTVIVVPGETLRSAERQAHLVRTGASKVARSNHQARPGRTKGEAVDIIVFRPDNTRVPVWDARVFRNIYRMVDPRPFGLTTGAHLWGWDERHMQPVELQGPGRDIGTKLEAYT